MEQSVRTLTRLFACGLVALAFAACDDHDHDHDHDHADPTEEACEHAAEGPFEAVNAAEAAAAPAIQGFEHSRVDITLLAGADGNGGSVAFNVAAEGDYVFFLSDDVPLAFSDDDGEVAIEATATIDACAEVAVSYTVELSPGVTVLTFGPTDATEVGLVFEAAGAHDHE